MRVKHWSCSILYLALMGAACQPVEQEYAPSPSLDTSPVPVAAEAPEGALRKVQAQLEAGDAKAVVRDLSALQPVTPLEKAWHRLLLGEAYFAMGASEKAYRYLLANYEDLRDARPAPEAGVSRVLARSLRKLGACFRERQEYAQAYTLHQLEWLYMRRLGTLRERHEALISLDVDAALLRNYFASEQTLREALQVAQQMPPGIDRERALLVSWNNLAGTLSELLRFQEAEAAAKESRRISQIYDPKSGGKEFREVWALAQLAEVYQSWAQYTETKNPAEAKGIYAKAQQAAMDAIALGDKQGLGENSLVRLETQMKRICGGYCRPPRG